jgi:pimeloyl-ACP methyl ester carboxylesterase
MNELGYKRFAAQGGDLGAGVSTALGLRHPDRIMGLHLNFIPGSYRPFLEPDVKLTSAEEEFFKVIGHWADQGGAYAHVQRTRPQTVAYGLNDPRPVWQPGFWKSSVSGLIAIVTSTADSRRTNC